jgi:hypothetical protein
MSTCLDQAYIEQMIISNGAVFVIKIKLLNNSYLDLVPNCEFNNKDYKFDFQTPIDTLFENIYKYNGIEKTALLSFNLDEHINIKEQQDNLKGILFLEDLFWCENTDENKKIQLEIYNKFQFLYENNGDFLTIESNYNDFLTKLNNNNSKGFYLFNNQFNYREFVVEITNNNFAVIFNIFLKKEFNNYGNADSLVFLSIMHKKSKKLNLNNNIINYLKKTIEQYYNELNENQLNNFKIDFSKLNDYILTIIQYNKI